MIMRAARVGVLMTFMKGMNSGTRSGKSAWHLQSPRMDVCLDSHIEAQDYVTMRQRASNPVLQCLFACRGSCVMKSIVPSATEFMSMTTKQARW
jgi:hypothetical protein